MDVILKATGAGQNVILTGLNGIQQSRFLLRCELALLAGASTLPASSRIIHVVSSDRIANLVHNEARAMPFKQLGHDIQVFLEGTDKRRNEQPADQRLQICTLNYLLGQDEATAQSLVVFDGITLENLEGSCCEYSERNKDKLDKTLKYFLPSTQFTKLTLASRNILLTCNLPVDDLDHELGVQFDLILDAKTIRQTRQRVTATVISQSERLPLVLGGLTPPELSEADKQHLYEFTGSILERSARNLGEVESPGGIVVFFPSYGKMVEYHNAWERGKVFERIGLPYGRENRGGDHFRNGLVKLAKERSSIFLCSIRYHKEEELAEFVMAQTRAVIILGLPYPFMNDTWEARINHNNEIQRNSPARLSGAQLHKFRAIEFLNGIIGRCLNEHRFKQCDFVLMDKELELASDKLTSELGDVVIQR